MPLPGSRDYDAVDTGPLPATTVNNIQDAIVALEADRAAERIEIHSIPSIMNQTSAAGTPVDIFSGVVEVVSTGSRAFVIPFSLRYGQRLKKWRTVINHDSGGGTHVLNIKLIRWGGVLFPATKSPLASYEFVPGQVTVVTGSLVGDELVESAAAPLPVIGEEEYLYGLEVTGILGGTPLGVIRLSTIAFTTDFP